jgi:hypothetical protein
MGVIIFIIVVMVIPAFSSLLFLHMGGKNVRMLSGLQVFSKIRG